MLYLFNNNEKLIRIVRKNAIRSLTQKQELKDSYVSDQLFSEIKPIDDTLLQEVEYLAIPSQEDHNKYHFYWLKDFNLDGDILSLTGVQSGIEELSKLPIYDQKPRELEASYVIDRLLDGTNWSRGYTAPTAKRNANFYYISVFDALKKLCQVWGLEMQFFVEITNHKLGNRFIEFKQKIGDNNGARVVYGHNALKVIKETNRSGLYTALIGRGKGEQVSTAGEVNSQGNITEADGYGRKINFADVTWSKSKGDPVDKPQGQQFVENREATALYGTPGINGATLPKIGFVDFQDEEDPEQLLRLTWQKLQEVDHPQVTFKTSTVYLDGKIGDTVRVVRPDKKIDYTTRIFRISWDRLTDTSTEVILGDKLLESQTTRTQRIVNLTTNHLSDSFMDQINNLSHAIMQASADRFSRNFYSRVDPREVTDQYGNAIVPRVDDTWYQPHPDHEGYTIIHIWDGEQWVIAMDTWSIKDEINQRIDEAVAEAEKIKEAAEKERKRVDQIYTTATGAKDLADRHSQILDKITQLTADQTEKIKSLSERDTINDEVEAEFIKNEGKIRYSQNRWLGDTTGYLDQGENCIKVRHNGEGYLPGKTYTLSIILYPHDMPAVPLATSYTAVSVATEIETEIGG